MLQGKQRFRVFLSFVACSILVASLYPVLASRPYSSGGKPRFNRYSQLLYSEANYCLGLLDLFALPFGNIQYLDSIFSKSHSQTFNFREL